MCRVVLIALLLTSISQLAYATPPCSLSARPACQVFWETPIVFTGVVTKVSPILSSYLDYYLHGSQTDLELRKVKVVLTVEQAFRGVSGGSLEIVTGPGEFREGERYLVYAHRAPTGETYLERCSRTRPFSSAAEDLAFLRGLAAAPNTGRLFGRHLFRPPVAGIGIVAAGPQGTYQTSTDTTGTYELTGLPPGRYVIRFTLPPSWKLGDNPQPVELHGKGCAQVDIWAHNFGRITGKVLLSDGSAPKPLPLDLVEETGASAVSFREWTDAEGRYVFAAVPPGRYLLGINSFPRIYYPGTADRKKAKPIVIEGGQSYESYDFVIPVR